MNIRYCCKKRVAGFDLGPMERRRTGVRDSEDWTSLAVDSKQGFPRPVTTAANLGPPN
jgi:hypothetical protein